jgi:hypothetical protein
VVGEQWSVVRKARSPVVSGSWLGVRKAGKIFVGEEWSVVRKAGTLRLRSEQALGPRERWGEGAKEQGSRDSWTVDLGSGNVNRKLRPGTATREQWPVVRKAGNPVVGEQWPAVSKRTGRGMDRREGAILVCASFIE